MSATAPANWYDDPELPNTIRYWDGTQWTDQRAPKPQQSGNNVTVVQARPQHKTSHGFHLIMTIITLGMWAPVWIVVGITNAARN